MKYVIFLKKIKEKERKTLLFSLYLSSCTPLM